MLMHRTFQTTVPSFYDAIECKINRSPYKLNAVQCLFLSVPADVNHLNAYECDCFWTRMRMRS